MVDVGSWGRGILDSDEARDVYDLFFHRYDQGDSAEAATAAVLARHRPEPGPEVHVDDVPLWLALAHAQWECRALTPDVAARVARLVEREVEKPLWERGWPARRTELRRFVKQLAALPARARRRVRPRLVEPPFAIGACIAFERGRGRWGAAVILDGAGYDRPREFASMLIAVTWLDQRRRPTAAEVARAEVTPSRLIVESFNAKELAASAAALARWHAVGRVEVGHRFEPFLYPMTSAWELGTRAAGAPAPDDVPRLTVAELVARPADPALAELGELFVGRGFREASTPEARHAEAREDRRRYVRHLIDAGWIARGKTFDQVAGTRRFAELIAFLERYQCYRERPHPFDGLATPVRRVLGDREL